MTKWNAAELGAFCATLKRLLPFDFPAPLVKSPRENADTCHTARSTNQKPLPDVLRLLELRAHRINNRDAAAAQRHIQKHLILSKGRFSDE